MAKLEKKHLEYLKEPILLEKYLKRINNKLVYSNNRVESNDKKYDTDNIYALDDNYKALIILVNKLTNKDKKLTPDLIIELADTINTHSMFISNGYRKIDNDISFDGKNTIEESKNIPSKIEELLDNYYNKWNNLNIFEREALFNKEFIRIHPFEDGNGRTGRLLLNYNMIINGHAPILMPEEKRKEYFKASNKNDITWIKNMYQEESKKELIALDKLIEEYELEKKLSSRTR